MEQDNDKMKTQLELEEANNKICYKETNDEGKDGKGLSIISVLISIPYASLLLYNLILHLTMHTDSSSDEACGICYLVFFLIFICGGIGLTSFIGNITSIIIYNKDKRKKKWFIKLLNVLNWISVLLFIACIIMFVSNIEW